LISYGFFSWLIHSFHLSNYFSHFSRELFFLIIWSPCHILISKHILSKYFSTSAIFLVFYFLFVQHMHLRSKRILWDFLVGDLFSDLSIKSLWFSRFINFFYISLFVLFLTTEQVYSNFVFFIGMLLKSFGNLNWKKCKKFNVEN